MPEATPSNLIGRELFLASLAEDGRRLGSAMHAVARKMDEITVAAGDAVYRLGEPSQYLFFVTAGEVKLTRPGAVDHSFGEREVFGTVDAMLSRGHAHSALAVKPSRLLRLRFEDWAELLDDNFELARRTLGRLARQLFELRLRPPPLGGFDAPSEASRRPREGLQVVDRILRLREVPVFASASTQALAALAQLGSTMFAGEGKVMFAAGETRGQLVVVASGEVSVAWEGSPTAMRVGQSSLVGGAASIGDRAWGEIRATTAARAIVIPLEDYFDVMEEHFDLVQSAFVALSEEREALLDRGR